MSDPVKLKRSMPLEGCTISHDGLIIRSVPDIAKIILQRSNNVTDSEMEVFGQKFDQTFGPELSQQVCRKTVSKDGTITAHCLNPTIWIILCDDQDVGTITGWFEAAAQEATITTSEITDQYICLDIEGRHAQALLAKGCALDLSSESFSENHVVRTLLAQTNIVLWRNKEDGYRILFDVSLSDYLWLWLKGAATEFSGM